MNNFTFKEYCVVVENEFANNPQKFQQEQQNFMYARSMIPKLTDWLNKWKQMANNPMAAHQYEKTIAMTLADPKIVAASRYFPFSLKQAVADFVNNDTRIYKSISLKYTGQ